LRIDSSWSLAKLLNIAGAPLRVLQRRRTDFNQQSKISNQNRLYCLAVASCLSAGVISRQIISRLRVIHVLSGVCREACANHRYELGKSRDTQWPVPYIVPSKVMAREF